ncbi:MAG: hypothetical protein R6V57_07890, partial [Vicinamibacterales bacterium]
YGGSMPSGWIRYIFEQTHPVKFDVVFPPTLDAGNLIQNYDVLIFPPGAIPAAPGEAAGGGRGGGMPAAAAGGGRGAQAGPSNIPAEYQGRQGRVTAETTVPMLRKFVEDGGTIITIGSSAEIAGHFGLPVTSGLVELVNGAERRLPNDKYFVPGSVLSMDVDPSHPLAYGFDGRVDVMWQNSPALKLGPDAAIKGVRPVGWIGTDKPLRSGWAWGQGYLKGLATALDVSYGKGKVLIFTPEITFRAQPHATYKFLFNGIYYGSAKAVVLPK